MRIRIVGPDFDDPDEQNNTSILLELGGKADGETRFTNGGLQVLEEDDKVVIDALTWDSKHKQLDRLFTMGDFDNPLVIDKVLLKRDRQPKELFYIPALLLLGLICMLQLGRQRRAKAQAA